MKKWVPKMLPLVVLMVVAGLLGVGFWPTRIQVDLTRATRGTLRVTVDEDGKTRIREKYTVSAPVSGKLFRIELEEGNAVSAQQTVLARIEPSDPALLDARAQAEAEARVHAAEASVQQAMAALQRAKEAYALAEHEYARALELVPKRTIAMSEFDQYEHRERMAQTDVRSADFGVAVANFELDLARVALTRTENNSADSRVPGTLTITSPIDGRVLRVLQENAGVVTPGTPLLEIGDPRDLEMEIDVLSTDAVKIRPGAAVIVEHWGGAGNLEGRVRLVEPAAFLKISALGVEEQRVNVIADFTSSFDQRTTLGDAYRIETRIVVDEVDDAILVATGALFQQRDRWHVFRIVDGRAALQQVEVGKSSRLETEVRSGVSEGEALILYPTDEIEHGTRVRVEPDREHDGR